MSSTKTPLCTETRHDHLLLHYVNGGLRTVESVDQLGNFLMGFGVLALGYLLHQDLAAVVRPLQSGPAHAHGVTLLALGAWCLAVALLVTFVWIYIFRVLAGRSMHATDGREERIGEVLDLPEDLEWGGFARGQRTFDEFLRTHYRAADRKTPESLLYARWSYIRFMTLRKLAEMQRMRSLLGLALLAGVGFKLLRVWQQALIG